MMMMVFWPHVYNCLAYMASLAKKYFWSNFLNRSLLITEGGTYVKMIYVEKIIHCFQRRSKKFKLSRNRLKKTLVVMFSDFWLLILFKSPLKNLTNNFFLCKTFWIYHGFLHCFGNILFYMFSATLIHTIKQKYYQTKLEKRMLCQIW